MLCGFGKEGIRSTEGCRVSSTKSELTNCLLEPLSRWWNSVEGAAEVPLGDNGEVGGGQRAILHEPHSE